MDADVAIDASAEDPGTPPVSDDAAESGTPPVDATAEGDGGDPAGAQEELDELERFARSKGFKSLDDKAARAAIGNTLGKTLTENARFAKELAEYKAKVAEYEQKLSTTPPEPQPEPEPPANVKELDEYISSLKAEKDAFPQTSNDLVEGILTLRDQITEARVRLSIADELDKPAKQADLNRLTGEQKLLQRQLDMLPRDAARVDAELRRAERDRKLAGESYEAEERARQEAGAQKETWNAEYVTTVDTLITRFATELKIDESLRPAMTEAVNDGLIGDLYRSAQVGIKDINTEQLVKTRVEKWAKTHGLTQAAKQAQIGKEKLAVTTPVKPAARTAPAASTGKPKLSIYEQIQAERDARVARFGR